MRTPPSNEMREKTASTVAAASAGSRAGANVNDETGKIESSRKCIFYAKFHVYSKDIQFIV